MFRICPLQQAMLDVLVSLSSPLMTKDELSASNLLRVTVETLYSLPDSWTFSSTAPYTFTAAMDVPLNAEVSGERFPLLTERTHNRNCDMTTFAA